MPQITLYLGDSTQALVDQAAAASGVSKSRWVAEAIRHYAAEEWPSDCLGLAGRFPDFPPQEDAPPVPVADTPRIGF